MVTKLQMAKIVSSSRLQVPVSNKHKKKVVEVTTSSEELFPKWFSIFLHRERRNESTATHAFPHSQVRLRLQTIQETYPPGTACKCGQFVLRGKIIKMKETTGCGFLSPNRESIVYILKIMRHNHARLPSRHFLLESEMVLINSQARP